MESQRLLCAHKARFATPPLPMTHRHLIVNGDDFGLHADINWAIQQAYLTGILTSTSIVACGQAFDEAVQIALACPKLDIGVHLTLVEERPCASPQLIPSLVTPQNHFWLNYRALTPRLLTGKIKLAEVRYELKTQIERVLQAGLRPSHLDSHQHVHVLPGIWEITVALAQEYQIPYIRIPRFDSLFAHTFSRPEPIFRLGMNVLSLWRKRHLPATLKTTDFTPGLYYSGRLTASALLPVLQNLAVGVSELVVHPGFTTPALQQTYHWNYHWQGEFEALVAPTIHQTMRDFDIQLTRFSELT